MRCPEIVQSAHGVQRVRSGHSGRRQREMRCVKMLGRPLKGVVASCSALWRPGVVVVVVAVAVVVVVVGVVVILLLLVVVVVIGSSGSSSSSSSSSGSRSR